MATYLLFQVVNQPFIDTNLVALSGGRIDTFLAGTSTPVATYSDNLGTSYGTSITLDSTGRTPHGWYGNQAVSYKIRVYSSSNVEQTEYQQDNITFPATTATTTLPDLQRGRSTITGTQNNYDLNAIATASQTRIDWWEWNGASACTLTGLAGGEDGRQVIVDNITAAQVLTLSQQSGSSTAANRLTLGTGLTSVLNPGQRATFLYDSTDVATSPWHVTISPAPFPRAGQSITQTIAPNGPLVQSVTTVGSVGSGETTLNSFSISANVLVLNGERLTGYFVGSTAANGNNKRFRLKFGSATILDTGASSAPNAQNWRIDVTVARTGAATQKVTAMMTAGANGSFATPAVTMSNGLTTETLSGAVTLALTGQGTSDNDIVNTEAAVWWHEAP